MPGNSTDTIAAIASGAGGAIAVLRVSGADATAVAGRVWRGRAAPGRLRPRELHLGYACTPDGTALDQCLLVRFAAPASYTGEDMVELHTHGGLYVARAVLAEVLRAGTRHAEPGEFTRRAFLNGKLDLTQAEAVADIVAAHTASALRLANRQAEGRLGRRVGTLYDRLTAVGAEVESRLDFPDERLGWLPPPRVLAEIHALRDEVAGLLATRRAGEILRHGIHVVIAGLPNVGKSSLMNAVLGRDRAIVTDIPGTTRDTLEELAQIRGIPVRLTDTAGLHTAAGPIERLGVERSLASLGAAQLVLWVYDASQPYAPQAPPPAVTPAPLLYVANKGDLVGEAPLPPGAPAGAVRVSALTGAGLDTLYEAIEHAVWESPDWREPECAVNARHAALLETAAASLSDAAAEVSREAWELAAVALRAATLATGRLIGRTAAPDVLDAIFSRFCIGK